MNEQRVLCVRRVVLEERLSGIPLGFTTDHARVMALQDAVSERGEFLLRPSVEEDPTVLQVIVQGLVTDGRSVLALFRKSRAQGASRFVETRHNAKIALSAGGHVDSQEADAPDILRAALQRELSEELVFAIPPSVSVLAPLGIVCNAEPDAPLFHRVHIGLVYQVPVFGEVRLPEDSDEFDDVEMSGPHRLRELTPRMEGWGQIIAQAILEGHVTLASPVGVPRSKE